MGKIAKRGGERIKLWMRGALKKGTVLTKRQKDIAFRGGLRFAYDEIQNAEEDREGVILDVVAKLARMMRGPRRGLFWNANNKQELLATNSQCIQSYLSREAEGGCPPGLNNKFPVANAANQSS